MLYIKFFESWVDDKRVINKSFNLTSKAIDDIVDYYLSERDYSANLQWQLDTIERIRKSAYVFLTKNYGIDNEGLITGFENFPNNIRLYRLIELDNIEDFESDKLGRFWTYDKNVFNSNEFLNSVGFDRKRDFYIIEAIFKKEDIDIIETIWMNCMLAETEKEIRIKKYDTKPIEFKIEKFYK